MSKRAVIPLINGKVPKVQEVSTVRCLPTIFPPWLGILFIKEKPLRVRPLVDSDSITENLSDGNHGKKKIFEIEQLPGASFRDEKNEAHGLIVREAVIDPENMMVAIKRGDIQSFRTLLKPDTDINTRGMWGNTPLIVACQYGREDVALEILKLPLVSVNASNEKGATALLYACLEGFTEVVEKLVSLQADVSIPPAVVYNSNTDQTSAYTPLSVAITNGHLRCVRAIIPTQCYPNDRFPLVFANGNIIKASADTGITPLMLACIHGHLDIVSYIMECKANPLLLDCTSCSALHYISKAKQNSVEIFCSIESFTPFPNEILNLANVSGDTALHVACDLKNPILVEELLKRGVNPNSRNCSGFTALHVAVKRRSLPLVSMLLQYDADVFVVDDKGASPLDLAAKLGKDSAIFKCLDAKANTAYSNESSAAEACS